MSKDCCQRFFFRWWPGICLFLFLFAGPVLGAETAAESAGGWRVTYDEIMKWVNFVIFVGVLVKFGRAPLVNFLKDKRKEVADEIRRAETRKTEAEEAVTAAMQQLEASGHHLEEVKARIIKEGERRKDRIIARARAESQTLMKASRSRIRGHIASAREQLRNEMIDAAFDIAHKRLPEKVTDQDNAHLANEFFEQAFSD